MARELLGVGIARQDRAADRVELGDDKQVLAVARRTEHPLAIREDAERPSGRAEVGQREERKLDGIVDIDYGRAYAAAIPLARFQLLPETGHSPQLETPDQVIHAIWDSADTDFTAFAR